MELANVFAGRNSPGPISHTATHSINLLLPTTRRFSDNSVTLFAVADVWVELLLSFSLRRNIATIFDKTVGVDTIPTVHGLKAISMAWVVLGHTCIVAFKYSGKPSL